MQVTSKQVIQELREGLKTIRDPKLVRNVRIVTKPEALILTDSLAPEVLIDLFGGCGGMMYTVTDQGPVGDSLLTVKVFYKNMSDDPARSSDTAEADAAIAGAKKRNVARDLLDELDNIQSDRKQAEELVRLTEQCTPKKGDSQAVILAKLSGIPEIVDKALKIKNENPGLWAMVIENRPPDMDPEFKDFKKGLKIGIETARKLLILLD